MRSIRCLALAVLCLAGSAVSAAGPPIDPGIYATAAPTVYQDDLAAAPALDVAATFQASQTVYVTGQAPPTFLELNDLQPHGLVAMGSATIGTEVRPLPPSIST